MAKNSDFIWCIAYINRDHINITEDELAKYHYDDIEAYIPTVRVLKKKFKGKNIFEFVPLLFNYGFFKIPFEKATNPNYLLEIRNRITCIYGWVKDPTKILNSSPRLRLDNMDSYKGITVTATATDEEVARLIKESKAISIYSAEDLERFKIGDYIKLKGYPFDDMPAEIVKINFKKKEVKVNLLMAELVKQVTVSFENVFYTVYKSNENKPSKEKSYDEVSNKFGNNAVDKMLYQNLDL